MRILNSRRAIVALVAIGCLTAIALIKGLDTSVAIASVAVAIAGGNVVQNALRKGDE